MIPPPWQILPLLKQLRQGRLDLASGGMVVDREMSRFYPYSFLRTLVVVVALLVGSTSTLAHFHSAHASEVFGSHEIEGGAHHCPHCALRSNLLTGVLQSVFSAPLVSTQYISNVGECAKIFAQASILKPYSQAPPVQRT